MPLSAYGQATGSAPTALTVDSDEIVVTGIRGSLISSAKIKRESIAVVDAITAQDLGKFPDSNVAESLQRIPGVSIDRSNGEGRFVTVRGLGPQFNTVLFNGRSFASDSYSRAFSFDLLAAELIDGAEVYKSSLARLQDGGIGATINLKTPRPLDTSGLRGVASTKANYEGTSKKVTPYLFALVSDTFADDRIGILASLSYQRRLATIDSVTVDGYLSGINVGPDSTNPIKANVSTPQNWNINNSDLDQKRFGATAVVQFKPAETLSITLDGLYNRYTSKAEIYSLGFWFDPGAVTASVADSSGVVTSTTANGRADMIHGPGNRKATTKEGGLNVDWQATDRLHFVVDATRSRAVNDTLGQNFNMVIGSGPTSYTYNMADGDKFPTVFGFAPGALTNVNDMFAHVAQRSGALTQETVTEAKFDTVWKSGGGFLSTIRAGGSYTNRQRKNVNAQSAGGNISGLYGGYTVKIPSSILSPITASEIAGNIPTTYLKFDPEGLLNYLASNQALSALDVVRGAAPGTSAARLQAAGGGKGYAVTNDAASTVHEKVYAAYAEADFEGSVENIPWFLNIGGRFVRTQTSISGNSLVLTDIIPVPAEPALYTKVYAGPGGLVNKANAYNTFLPDFNLRLNVTPEVIIRFAGSQTLTRPNLTDLSPVVSYGDSRPSGLFLSGGNPYLRPYKSTNFDASIEWYPQRSTMLSAAAYFKKVNDYIVTSVTKEDIAIINSGKISLNNVITGANQATFTATRPQNVGSANIKGIELNIVHTLDWLPSVINGFGVQLNATFVGTNRAYDKVSESVPFAIVGLSNSQNATLFYEKYGVSARIAYNHRGRFLATLQDGYGSQPLFVKAYGQYDASMSYNISKIYQIYVEGTNLFNDKYSTTTQYDNQVRSYVNNGARFTTGVRVKF
ncbi:TonB-dependent receptor [Sphingomonas sp. PP-F2F-A104-K0414]|uniref:TonB-dependent receptor n=1 Tax=Sphingomonas sp. PP-F2F-A104-K0414 TaxID=2135661 RepID=UPI001404EB95|nr:TonB-dependent receptor [Sphingomonas sp. PP-F2F-A104-K0414]